MSSFIKSQELTYFLIWNPQILRVGLEDLIYKVQLIHIIMFGNNKILIDFLTATNYFQQVVLFLLYWD